MHDEEAPDEFSSVGLDRTAWLRPQLFPEIPVRLLEESRWTVAKLDTWTFEDERIYRDNLEIVDKLHWESYKQRDEFELAHHLIYHQGEEINNQGDEIKELRRMVRIALDSAQAAKGAVVQVLADMTALERGNSPYRMATDSRRPTEGPSTASSSTGPWRMYPVSKRAACKRAKARSQGDQG